jgi:hypothetical protein
VEVGEGVTSVKPGEHVIPLVDPLFDALTSAPAKQRIGLAGGDSSGCGYHLFSGIDAEFVRATAGFIDKHNPTRP